MKFLIDANLPFKLAIKLKNNSFDILHTDNLPNKERTTDKEIRLYAVQQQRVVITKDSDFLDSHLILGIPEKLLLITKGNINNRDLISLVENNFDRIIQLFNIYNLIELNNEEIIGHEK
jgi:predicted nuclease of predicted toxin-antitoxin system